MLIVEFTTNFLKKAFVQNINILFYGSEWTHILKTLISQLCMCK